AWLTTPLVAVTDGELRAGRARIPVSLLGEPVALDAIATRAALGPDLDARAFVCLRAWAGTAVQVPVNDPRDPTPYWFVSSRRPWLRMVRPRTRCTRAGRSSRARAASGGARGSTRST